MSFSENLQALAGALISVDTLTIPPGVELGEVDRQSFEKNAQAARHADTIGRLLRDDLLLESHLLQLSGWFRRFATGPYVKREEIRGIGQALEKLQQSEDGKLSLLCSGIIYRAAPLADAHKWNVALWNNIEAQGGTVFAAEMKLQSEQHRKMVAFLASIS